jgi:thioredoxin 1
MAKYIEATAADFDATVAEGVTMVDFWAPWCGPCRMIAPVVEELAEEFDGKAKIVKVNTDEEQDIAVKYGVRSIPTIIFFKDGVQVDTMVGAASKEAFADKINSFL